MSCGHPQRRLFYCMLHTVAARWVRTTMLATSVPFEASKVAEGCRGSAPPAEVFTVQVENFTEGCAAHSTASFGCNFSTPLLGFWG
eukprot:2745188-Amphidinium_carterae.1